VAKTWAEFNAWLDCVFVAGSLGVLSPELGTRGAEGGVLVNSPIGGTGAPAPCLIGPGKVSDSGIGAAIGTAIGAVAETISTVGVDRCNAHPVPLMINRAPTHRDATRTNPLGLRVITRFSEKSRLGRWWDWATRLMGPAQTLPVKPVAGAIVQST